MATHSQLAAQVEELFSNYANPKYYRIQFKTAPKGALERLVQLHEQFRKPVPKQRPPAPVVRIPRGEAHDQYKTGMQSFFTSIGADVPTNELNIPQIEAVANYLTGIEHPPDEMYREIKLTFRSRRGGVDNCLISFLGDYACSFYFPVRIHDLRADHKRQILGFLEHFNTRLKHRPPLPKHRKIFMNDYHQYRKRAQAVFDQTGFPVHVAYLNLGLIEALLNFMAGLRYPDKMRYQRVFAANAKPPVHYFVETYKPYENSRYPISVGQYHGRKNEIVPLLYFSPAEPVQRWFAPPNSTKIKSGRRHLFLNYHVMFKQLGIEVHPSRLPIAYIEAVLNYAQAKAVESGSREKSLPIQKAV